MRDRFYIRSVSGAKDGVALLMVLALIVLLTILIVSFISFNRLNRLSTASYSKSIQAQEIAEGGMGEILGDLHQEIIAGSTLQNGGSSTYPPVYVPTTNWTAQPARLGYNPAYYGSDVTSVSLPPSLLRVSRATQDGTATHFYPALNTTYYTGTLPQNRASAANSSTNSINGHYISPARWNKIALLSTNSTIPLAFSTNTPDWVMVTRGGSRVCSTGDLTSTTTNIKPSTSLTTTTAVVGRYAYAVYDEGALLDVNAAGYVSSATNSFASAVPATIYTNPTTGVSQVITSKTYSSYADLTQLPGLSGDQNIVDNLIEWRNASVTMTGSTGGVNFYQAAFTNAKNGFKTFASGDSPLLSRQDLINYFAQIDPTGTSYSAALPFLGTFTRAANAPSWTPAANSSALPGYTTTAYTGIAAVNYKSNAETAPNANRDLYNVRYPSTTPAGTVINHIADDGTVTPYTIKAGDPLVQRRFSLAKLSWLTYKGPSATNGGNPGGTAANIETCFGLVWTHNNEGNNCWKYDAGTSGPAAIQTLDLVAAGSNGTSHPGYREPNFFEMLKAGILSGSLGQSPGPVVGIKGGNGAGNTSDINGNNGNIEGVAGLNFDTYSPDKERHILQIGANIIDQSDSDSYPTTIFMPLVGPTPPSTSLLPEDDLSLNNVYGDENLPSLSRVYAFTVETPAKYMKMWIHPELWNPHQAPGTNVTLANKPTQFRVHAYGKVSFKVGWGNLYAFSTALDYETGSVVYHDNSGNAQTVNGTDCALIYFNDPNTGTAASPFFSNPARLDSALSGVTFPNTTTPINIWGVTGNAGVKNVASDTDGNADEKFAAFLAGEVPTDMTSHGSISPPALNWVGQAGNLYNVYAFPLNPLYFTLEYQDPNNASAWIPYSFMSRIDEQTCLSQTYAVNGAPPIDYGASGPAQGGTYPFWSLAHPDPRTDRLSCMEVAQPGNGRWQIDSSIDAGSGTVPQTSQSVGGPQGTSNEFPVRNYGFAYYPTPVTAHGSGPQYLSFWAENQPGVTTYNAYYVDPDQVVRPGDGYRRNTAAINYTGSSPAYVTSNSGDGSLILNGFASTTPTSTPFPTSLSASPVGSAQARRPVVLNRPFRSVGELGYVYRDVPFKTLDFFSDESADAALLDLFSVADEPAVSAGEINISSAPASVIKAVLAGTSKMEINNPASANVSSGSPNFVTSSEASAAAAAIQTYFGTSGPLNSRADLVTKLSDPIFSSLITINPNYANKAYAEAPVRALADVSSTRTWNLLIDIIAQSGFMAPSATSLNDFVVTGERRYWLHVSIDRLTSKILDQQLEPVYE